jgi:dual specificity protein kinase CLK2/3
LFLFAKTLEFLHGCGLIHTDLKVENVLLMNSREVPYGNNTRHLVPQSTRIKLIDFGGATYDKDKKSSVINTRQYRAPEVILGTGWSMPSDIWSAGCVLAELYKGELLFSTHDNMEHLALMERMLGAFPRDMVELSKEDGSKMAQEAFDSKGWHRSGRVLSAESALYVRKTGPLESILSNPRDAWFVELLRRMLVMDPRERGTARECLQYLARIRKDVTRYT